MLEGPVQGWVLGLGWCSFTVLSRRHDVLRKCPFPAARAHALGLPAGLPLLSNA